MDTVVHLIKRGAGQDLSAGFKVNSVEDVRVEFEQKQTLTGELELWCIS